MSNKEPRLTQRPLSKDRDNFDLNLRWLSLRIRVNNEAEHPRIWVPLGDTIHHEQDERSGKIVIADNSRVRAAGGRIATLEASTTDFAKIQSVTVSGRPSRVFCEGNGQPLGHNELAMTVQGAGLVVCSNNVQLGELDVRGEALGVFDTSKIRELRGEVHRYGVDPTSTVECSEGLNVITNEPLRPLISGHHPDDLQ